MNDKPLTYLTVPYSHRDPQVREARYIQATKAAAWLMTTYGWNVFSPITHSHPLYAIAGMRGDWEFWAKVDTQYLGVSERIVNYLLPGWEDSVGVQAENRIARDLKLPIFSLEGLAPDFTCFVGGSPWNTRNEYCLYDYCLL